MASTGFVAEFSRKPLWLKLGVLAIVMALLGIGWFQLFYSKLKKDIDAAKAQAQSLNESKKKIEADEERYEELDKQQKRLKQLIEENDNALPTAAQLPAFFDMLNRKVAESGVVVLGWEYQKEVPVEETIYKVPVEITMQGTFYQIERFFYLLYKVNQKEGEEAGATAPTAPVPDDAMQERDRILTIEDLSIYEPVVQNGELLVTATFRASTFRKEEPPPAVEDPADKKKKPAKGKKGDGGVLDKPNEAKEKVDDAMKKDDERARGADNVKGGM